MSHVYTPAKYQLLLSGLASFASGDFRLIAVMANSTADVDEDAQFVSNISVLDEFNGSGYSRAVLAGKSVTQDDPNDLAYFDATNVSWSSLGPGTRQIKGFVLYQHVTNDSDSRVIGYYDGSILPANGNGGTFNVAWNAAGALKAA